MNDPARLLSCAGGLMAVSGILMALSAEPAVGGPPLGGRRPGLFAAAYLFSDRMKGETK